MSERTVIGRSKSAPSGDHGTVDKGGHRSVRGLRLFCIRLGRSAHPRSLFYTSGKSEVMQDAVCASRIPWDVFFGTPRQMNLFATTPVAYLCRFGMFLYLKHRVIGTIQMVSPQRDSRHDDDRYFIDRHRRRQDEQPPLSSFRTHHYQRPVHTRPDRVQSGPLDTLEMLNWPRTIALPLVQR